MIAAAFLAAALASGPEVIAIVDQIQGHGMQDHLTDGNVISWTVVTLTVLSPKDKNDKYVQVKAYCAGHPVVGSQPLLIGRHVTFRLPPANKRDHIPLSDLSELRMYGTPLSPPIPMDAAKRVFDEARAASAEDDGKLWGKLLFGPAILVDPKTRFYVRDDGAGWTLPEDVIIANTATKIDGVLTTMIAWTSIGGSSAGRRRLVLHESWHRIQNELGFPANSPNNAHLDTVDGRYWLRLELRALAAALRAAGDARTAAIRDAIAFRAARRAQFAEAVETERALENNEGLAEYTGWALRGTSADESRFTFARHLDNIDPGTSFVRGFAYETGPAYGLLLDALAPGWTRAYKVTDDLAAVLAASAEGLKPAATRPELYGGAELRAAEEKRDREQRERVARFRARLVDGPVLELPMTDAHYGFDPNGVTALGDAGNAYQTLEVTAAWGRISVDAGARISGDWTTIFVAAEDRAKLELKPGWKVVASARQSDLRVVCE